MPTSSEHRALCPNLRRIVYSIHEGIKFTILWLLLSAHGEKCLASNSASTAECFVTPTSTPNSFVQETTLKSISNIVLYTTSISSGQGTSFSTTQPSSAPLHSASQMANTSSTSQMANTSSTSQMANTSSNSQMANTSSTSQMANTSSTSQMANTSSNSQMANTSSTSQMANTSSTSQMANTSSNSQMANTSSTSQMANTSSTSQMANTSCTSLMANTSSNSQMANTSSTSQMANTSSTSQMATASSTSQMATTSCASQMNTTSSTSQMVTTSSTSQMATTSSTSQMVTTSSTSQMATTSSTSQMATTSSTSQMVTTSSTSQMATTSSTSQMVTTSSTSQMATTSSTSQMVTTSSTSQMVTTSSTSQMANTCSNSQMATASSTSQMATILPTTTTTTTTTTIAITVLATPMECSNRALSCASSISHPSTSTLYSTDNPQTTSALFTISVVQSWTLAVSTPTTHDQTYIAIVTAAFIAIGCAVILGISLALIIGVSLAFIAYARSSRPTGHRQRIKADDEFHCVNKNHYISEDIRTSDIETTFGAEQSNGGGESDTLSLEDLSTFQKLTEPSLGPIQVSDFQQYMSDLKSGRGIQLAVQFRTIEAYSLSLSTDKHHVCSERSSKDRYTNILPYLHSRVKLTQGPGLDDYINASYIDGYNQKDRYIAAQGPMKNTLEDFWRMVWECSVDMIVMLTKCCENGQSKCEQYWAGKVGGAFETGLFSIVTASFVHMLDYEIRTLVLTNNSDPNSKPRKLTHYYYTAWPDHGVPRNPSSMVGFVRQIQRAHARNEGVPLLVHCSAGVGRTGTFMVLDAMLKRIVWEGTVDVYGFLKHIRSQRCMLVQTVDQFSFIHDVLNDFLICGDTEILACDLKVKVKEMQTPINGQTMNAFQKQFELLGQLSIKQAEDDVSNKEDMLSSTLASSFSADRPTKSEEITAICFIDGFQQRSAYMVAQAPDECRRSSFWEAIKKHQARVLVVLGRVQHVYWPQENGQSITCDKLEVQHQSTCTQDGGILERCLRIVNESSVMDVVQLELTEWPAEGQPETAIMIQLLEAVTKTQLATLTRCTAVLSSDGAVGEAGMFVSLHSELEHLKAEGSVDLFQRVRVCREQCPAFLKNETQYEYCHLVLTDFVNSMSEYANFN